MRKIANMLGYKIKISKHADTLKNQHNIDDMRIISCVTYLGILKLKEYANNDTDVLITDETNKFSLVFTINNGNINIITIINQNDSFLKSQISK